MTTVSVTLSQPQDGGWSSRDYEQPPYSVSPNNVTTTNTTLDIDMKYATWQISLIAIVLGIVILFIVLGNALVILAIAVDRTLSHVQNYFIGSLAVSDLLLGLLVMPLSLTYELTGHWFFGDIVCDLWLCTDVLLCTASILNLCLISLDRYWSITHAVSYAQWRTARRAMIMITVVWGLSTVICLPPLVGWKRPYTGEDEMGRQACALSSEKGYVAYSVLGSFYAPLVVMVVVYVQIYFAARSRARRNLKKKPSSTHSRPAVDDFGDGKLRSESLSVDVPLKHAHVTATSSTLALPASVDDHNTYEWGEYERTSSTCWHPTDNNTHVSKSSLVLTRDDSTQPLTEDILSTGGETASSYATSVGFLSPSNSNGHVTGCANHKHVSGTMTSLPENGWTNSSLQQLDQSDARSLKTSLSNASNVSIPRNGRKASVNALTASPRRGSHGNRAKQTREYILAVVSKGRRGTGVSTDGRGGGGAGLALSIEEEQQRAKRLLAKQRERRATIVLGIVMLTFILCWLPFFITYPIATFLDLKVPDQVFAVFFWAGYCNSAMNPIIYTIFNRDFRHAFQRVLRISR
jgi:hypothetical protein